MRLTRLFSPIRSLPTIFPFLSPSPSSIPCSSTSTTSLSDICPNTGPRLSPLSSFPMVMVMIMSRAPDPFLCAFPLSGHYALLQRIHFYLVFLFAVRATSSSWLVGGAFAAAMSVAAVAAVHALILLISSSNASPPILDLDVAGTWSLLAPSALLVPSFLSWTPALRGSGARSLIRLWGAFITLGTACTFAALVRSYPSFPNAPPCPTASSPIRDAHALYATPHTDVFGLRFTPVLVLGIIALAFLALVTLPACLFDVPAAHPPPRRSLGALSLLPDPTDIARPVALRFRWIGNLRTLGAFLSVPLAAISVGFTEKWIAYLPGGESPRTIGQWAVWAATGLVVIAGVLKGGPDPAPVPTTTRRTRNAAGNMDGLIRIV